MKYQRKTVDFYKMEIFIKDTKNKKGKWETILDTDNFDEYKKLLNELYLKPWIKRRGKKYRRDLTT